MGLANNEALGHAKDRAWISGEETGEGIKHAKQNKIQVLSTASIISVSAHLASTRWHLQLRNYISKKGSKRKNTVGKQCPDVR